jgi:hypothetical protein
MIRLKPKLIRDHNRRGNAMHMRWIFCGSILVFAFQAGLGSGEFSGSSAHAQDPNIRTDASTGIRYQRQFRTVNTPVAQTQMENKVVTISRPEVVTETEPVTSTYFTPVVRYGWRPRWKNTWNPFVPATLAYEFAPETTWEARSETTNRLKTSTRWVAKEEVIQEPKLVTGMRQEQVEDWIALGPDPNFRPGQTAGTQIANLPAPSRMTTPRLSTTTQPTRPEISGGMPATDLTDPYSTRTYVAPTIYR